jgi:HEAT repeat protein
LSHPPPDRPDLGDAGPSEGARFLLVMAREAPLSLDELAALRGAASGAPALPDLQVDAIEGYGKVRVRVTFTHPGTLDLEASLTGLPPLLHALARAVPRCKVRVSDPAGLLSWTGSRFSLDPSSARALPGIREGYAVPETARLVSLVATAGPGPVPSASASCAADLLEAIARGGMAPARAAAAADIDDSRLVELVEGRVLPGPAARVLAARDALPPQLAQALLRDGDAREREATGQAPPPEQADQAAPPPALEPGAVIALGRVVLARPGIGEDDDEDEDDDLLLLDEDEEGADPLELALADLAGHETVAAAQGVADEAGFPRRLLDRLGGFNDSATGACLLLCLGAWSANGVPGSTGALRTIVGDPERPWALRALALRAIAGTQRPDARAAIIEATADEDIRVAAAALILAAGLTGADARSAARAALDREGTRLAGLRAASSAADPGAKAGALSAASDEDFMVRAAAADALPRIAAGRGLDTLRTLLGDPSWEVRRAAARALALIGDSADVARATETGDAEVLTAVIVALGDADRTDAWPRLLAASRHARPGVRAAAAEALARLGLPAATPHLTRLVSDANPMVRVAALKALGGCGDRRSVHALRRHAGAGGAVGEAALASLESGRSLRQAAPDGRIRVRVRGPLSEADRAGLATRLGEAGLAVVPLGEDLVATGTVDPDDVPRLSALRAALAAADADVPGQAWSVRDGQYALRRLGGHWVLSSRRGQIARDAGWFDDPLPVPVERAPLAKLPRGASGPSSPMAMAPLPVSVMRYVTGRKQVVAASDPHRPYDPDEITGEVPIQPALPDEAPDPDEVTGETAGVRAAQAGEDDANEDEAGAPALPALPPAPEPAPPPPAPPVLPPPAFVDDGAPDEDGTPAVDADDADPTPDGGDSDEDRAADGPEVDDADDDGVNDESVDDEAGDAAQDAEDFPDDDSDELILDEEFELDPPEAAGDPETEKVQPVAAASDWDDLISERRGADAVARIAARGLTEAERQQLVTWLGSGLPGIQRAAATLAGATREPRTFGPLITLLASADARLRATAATALGELGDPAALEGLESARADDDAQVVAAAEAGIARICGLDDAAGEE